MDAISGKRSGKTPIALTLSLFGSKITSCPAATYYTDPEAYFKGQKAVMELCDPDVVTTPLALPFEGEVYGGTIKLIDKAPPQLQRPAIDSYSRVKELKVPSAGAGSKAYVLETASLLASSYKNKKVIIGFTLSCIDACAMIMGMEGFMDTLLFHRDEARRLFEITSMHFTEYSNALFKAGIDILVIPSAFCSHTIITAKIIEELTLDPLSRSLKEINGPVIIHHGSSKNLRLLHYFVDLPNIAGFVVDDREKLETARQIAGNKLLLGNMNITLIASAAPEAIRKKCRGILDDRAGDNHFIFSNSGPEILYETPPENITEIINTVRSYK
jgi:uroporphyrinogen decarboxylase